MTARFTILPMLWILAAGLLPTAGCGRSTGAADGSPAAVASEKPPRTLDTPAKKLTTAAAEFTSPREPKVDAAPQPQAQTILQAAVRAIEGHDCVSARIVQQVDLFDKQLVGKGVYLQQRMSRGQLPPDGNTAPLGPLAVKDAQTKPGGEGSWDRLLIRLELRIQVGEQQSTLLQVLSPPTPAGHYLWTYRKLPDEEKLGRVDVVRAVQALDTARHAPGPGNEGMLSGLGGLPRLLRGLQAALDFSSAEQGQFGKLAVWRLQGQWRPDRLARILPQQKAAIEAGELPELGKLPEHLPDRVVLMLGQDDLFPYRIEYRRGVPEKAGEPDDSRALVTMELFDVKFDVPVDPTRFIYNRGALGFADETDSFISSLRATQ